MPLMKMMSDLRDIIGQLRWWLFLWCWTTVLWGMYTPGSQTPQLAPGFDKLVHLLALLAMAFTARWAGSALPARLFWPGMLVLSALLEALQPVVQPSRTLSGLDMTANLVGVLLALACWRFRPAWIQ